MDETPANRLFLCLQFKNIIGITILVTLTTISGCGESYVRREVEDFEKYLTDPKVFRLALQICMPEKTVFFDELQVDITDVPSDYGVWMRPSKEAKNNSTSEANSEKRQIQSVRQWRLPTFPTDVERRYIIGGVVSNKRGIWSESGMTAYLSETTEAHQPVFFYQTNVRPSDIVGIYVSEKMTINGQRRMYWFNPPQEKVDMNPSKWESPVSEEGPNHSSGMRSTSLELMRGKKMPRYPVSGKAPKVRYTLYTLEQIRGNGKVPPLTRARHVLVQEYKLKYPSDQLYDEKTHVIAPKREDVPAC